MSDYQDLVARLREDGWLRNTRDGGLPDGAPYDAATAIETLRRERDEAERLLDLTIKQRDEARADADKSSANWHELHAALHAACDRAEQAEQARDAAITRAEKAELQVTEYELARDAVLCELGRDLNAVNAERDALRALLIETRPFVQDSAGFTHHELRARIDAALAGDDNAD